MTPEHDLHMLAGEEPAPALDARVRRLAHAELEAAAGPRWRVLATRAWTNLALPAAVTVTVVGYLHWAMTAASAMYH